MHSPIISFLDFSGLGALEVEGKSERKRERSPDGLQWACLPRGQLGPTKDLKSIVRSFQINGPFKKIPLS